MSWLEEYDEYMKDVTKEVEGHVEYRLASDDGRPHYKFGAVTAIMYDEIQQLKQDIENLKKQIK